MVEQWNFERKQGRKRTIAGKKGRVREGDGWMTDTSWFGTDYQIISNRTAAAEWCVFWW